MAPCRAAQEYVASRACTSAGVQPDTVDYVEAHGTGTALGDPVEAAALSAVYGRGRATGEPCFIGSVKSNIGHLEGAAGVAGLIKVLLALGHAKVPASPLSSTVNPRIPWDNSGIRLVTEHLPAATTASATGRRFLVRLRRYGRARHTRAGTRHPTAIRRCGYRWC